jgi:hypothetical protein
VNDLGIFIAPPPRFDLEITPKLIKMDVGQLANLLATSGCLGFRIVARGRAFS